MGTISTAVRPQNLHGRDIRACSRMRRRRSTRDEKGDRGLTTVPPSQRAQETEATEATVSSHMTIPLTQVPVSREYVAGEQHRTQ